MQGDGGFARSSHPLNDLSVRPVISDNLILFFLNRRDNGFHLLIRWIGKFSLQYVVLHIGGTLQGIFHDAAFDFELSFLRQFPCNFAYRRLVLCRTQFIIIEHAGNGCAPVDNQQLRVIVESIGADIVR